MKRLVFLVTIVFVLLLIFSFPKVNHPSSILVHRVIDGDTFETSDGNRIRLYGINAPEKGQYFYSEATTKLRDLIENKTPILEKDVLDRDIYGRLVRYVFINETFVNLEMLREGYAHIFNLSSDTKYYSQLVEAEEIARNEKIGIWEPSEFSSCVNITLFHYNARGIESKNLNDEYVVFKNICQFSINLTNWSVNDESNNKYLFPKFVLNKLESIKLRTGFGTNNSTDLFWRSKIPIWDNSGDTLFLRDEKGFLVLFYRY